jgi:hypothetical protein
MLNMLNMVNMQDSLKSRDHRAAATSPRDIM